jgi:uncharacterized protein YjbJ (UPF0337 family)
VFIYALLAASDPDPDFSPNDRDIVELRPHRRIVIPRSERGDVRQQETLMNWDQIQGDWMQFKNKVRMNWVKLTDEDLTRIGGRRAELVSRLQARYGFGKNEAEREIDAWMKTQRQAA